MQAEQLVANLGSATNQTLATQLLEEATKLEEAFALRRWQSTELDGGRFAEVAARIIYGVDSGSFNLSKSVDDCLKYVENTNVAHGFPDPKSANQLVLILRSVYKLRSQRGAVHVSPTYTANEIDSRMVVEGVRWVLAELLRVFVTTNQAMLVSAIIELSRFPSPLIRYYNGKPLVQSVNLTTEEEVLVHLMNRPEGYGTGELIQLIPKDPTGIRKAVKTLSSGLSRQIIAVAQKWQITDLGIARIDKRFTSQSTGTS